MRVFGLDSAVSEQGAMGNFFNIIKTHQVQLTTAEHLKQMSDNQLLKKASVSCS